ncbi:hypothetical protein Rmf_12490 [Roseomonas fluvialis]|uniref:Uncharacterized protein n=1 Tax=Roseomonas fluvialis TaxID=1750527 RepID=A0ABN6NY37_9PROT|nr:hypothetical protein Rmf_12490 [Roseomonas fluvialis]
MARPGGPPEGFAVGGRAPAGRASGAGDPARQSTSAAHMRRIGAKIKDFRLSGRVDGGGAQR